ncbi:hypothetical protein BSZ35_00110 [Salinibacter sp. 10B]|uniref:hypothetical protein n=1 Tax=Salinibacter sp. 10B TaxID=1923971 RepID=UPI000CF50076|nr:hypothetical protein [Salinibacter sp. 10B]PQJ36793.1 hypothetical protein BSZ35_00110 [Salinibacter sp. 10B]
MKTVLPDIESFSFREEFGSEILHDVEEAERNRPDLDRFIRSRPEKAVIALDLRGLEYIGYSYSKPTVRTPLRRQSSGEYGDRHIILLSEEQDDFLDGIETALSEEGMAVLVASSADDPLSDIKPIGEVKPHLMETFEVVRESAPATTAEVASRLGQSVQNANNRLRSLDELGLIRREKVSSPSGGQEWQVRVL